MTAMENFDEVFREIKDRAFMLFKDNLLKYTGDLKQDTEAFMQESRESMKLWGRELAKGEATKEDVAWLAKGELSLGEMFAKQQAGKAAIELDKLQNSLVGIVVDSLAKLKP